MGLCQSSARDPAVAWYCFDTNPQPELVQGAMGPWGLPCAAGSNLYERPGVLIVFLMHRYSYSSDVSVGVPLRLVGEKTPGFLKDSPGLHQMFLKDSAQILEGFFQGYPKASWRIA